MFYRITFEGGKIDGECFVFKGCGLDAVEKPRLGRV